jgi:hypothetical protein
VKPAGEKTPPAATWFAALKALGDTSYEKEILAQCEDYKEWKRRK